MIINFKKLILSNGKNGISLYKIKKKYEDILDFKEMNQIFSKMNKNLFCFKKENKQKKSMKLCCLWETSREEYLGNFVINSQINEICAQILRKIFYSRELGIFQHTIGSELGLRTRDIHHHINNLIKTNLIVKKNLTIKSRSKLKNVIQLKCKIFDNKISKGFFFQYFSDNKEIEIFKNLVKILTRIDRPIKQKNLKYGVLEHNNTLFDERRRFHRNWQKAKQKFLKAKIDILKTIENNFQKKAIIHPRKEKIPNKYNNQTQLIDNFKKVKGNLDLLLLFLISPEIQIKKSIENNFYFGISSPYLLEKFRGYISYKNIQLILRSLETKKYLFKTLEQRGRQRIVKYKKNNEVLNEYEKRIKFEVTDQVAYRRLTLLSWVESQVLLVRDLGKRMANQENKGLKKIDSKVIRKVLRDLIEKGFLKVFKINIQLSNKKSKNIEIIAKKDFRPKNFDFASYINQKFSFLDKTGEKKKKENFFEKKKDYHPLLVNLFVFTDEFWNFSEKNTGIKKVSYKIFKGKWSFNYKDSSMVDFFGHALKFSARNFFQVNSINLNCLPQQLVKKKSIFLDLWACLKNLSCPLKKIKNFTIFHNIFYQTNFKKKKKISRINPKITNNVFNVQKKPFYQSTSLFSLKKETTFIKFSFKEKKVNFKIIMHHKTASNQFSGRIKIKDLSQANAALEKWDTELDVRLLEKYLIKKCEIGTKLKVELKKNFARRLIGILKVENIKIAISYFNSFLNLDFVDSFFKTIYTPRNFFKRALELPISSFCFSFREFQQAKKYEKSKMETFIGKKDKNNEVHIQKNFLKYNSWGNKKFQCLPSNKLLWKFVLMLSMKLNLINNSRLNKEKNLIFNRKLKNIKNAEKKFKKTIMKNNFKKKKSGNIFYINWLQKYILWNLASKINKNISNIIPFFLDNTLNKYGILKTYTELKMDRDNKAEAKNIGKISKPLELRSRNINSLYKNSSKFLNKLEINLKFIELRLKKISFFTKINCLHKSIREALINRYNLLYFYISKDLEKKSKIKNDKLFMNLFKDFFYWTAYIFYFLKKSYFYNKIEYFELCIRYFEKKIYHFINKRTKNKGFENWFKKFSRVSFKEDKNNQKRNNMLFPWIKTSIYDSRNNFMAINQNTIFMSRGSVFKIKFKKNFIY